MSVQTQPCLATALELFRLGLGTDRIAEYYSISEAEALRRLNIERSNEKHLPSPYEVANG